MATPFVSGPVRRAAIVVFVEEYWRQHGIAPTAREVAAGCGLSSFSGAIYQIDKLVAEGRLTRVPRIPRSIRVVER